MNGFHSENKCGLQKCTFQNPKHFLGGAFFALFYSEYVLKCNCYVNSSKKKGVQLHGDKCIFRCCVSLANRLFILGDDDDDDDDSSRLWHLLPSGPFVVVFIHSFTEPSRQPR